MGAAICLSTSLFLLGLMSIFYRDFAWDIQEWLNKSGGKVSERAEEWDQSTMIAGIWGIILAFIILVWANSVS